MNCFLKAVIFLCLTFLASVKANDDEKNTIVPQDQNPELPLGPDEVALKSASDSLEASTKGGKGGASVTVPIPVTILKPLTISIGEKPTEEVVEDQSCNKDSIICANICKDVGRSHGSFLSNPTPNDPDGGRCVCKCKAVEHVGSKVCGFADVSSKVRDAACSTFCRQNDVFKYASGSCLGSDCICDCFLYDPFDANNHIAWNWSN